MCKLFIGASPDLWEATTRSLRIDGMVTSVRLESYFWCVLEEIAARDSLTLPEMSGDIPIQPEISIASLDADNILQNEAQRNVLNGWSLLASSGPIV